MDNVKSKEEIKAHIIESANRLISFYNNLDDDFFVKNDVMGINIHTENYAFDEFKSINSFLDFYEGINKSFNNSLRYCFSCNETRLINFQYYDDGIFSSFAIKATEEVMKQYEKYRIKNGLEVKYL